MKYLDKAASTLRKKRATKISIATATSLLIAKIFIFAYTASLAVLASAIDSLLDLLVSTTNFYIVKQSEKAPTENFRFGYGRIEEIAGLFQGMLIAGIGVSIIVAIFMGDHLDNTIQNPTAVLWMMGISMLITWQLSRFLESEATVTRSSVLIADAAHYRADLLSNAGIFVSVILIMLTDWSYIDAGVCLILAIFIIYDGAHIATDALHVLLDREAEPDVREKIISTIERFTNEGKVGGFHALRTRKTGSKYFAEFHLEFNPDILLKDAHVIAHQLEDAICQLLPQIGRAHV